LLATDLDLIRVSAPAWSSSHPAIMCEDFLGCAFEGAQRRNGPVKEPAVLASAFLLTPSWQQPPQRPE
jgi:hypothetical protein